LLWTLQNSSTSLFLFLQFPSSSQLHSALAAVVSLALSRYNCSLQHDQQLMQQQQQQHKKQQQDAVLLPRLAAAVVARMGEKEVWGELQQVGGGVCVAGLSFSREARFRVGNSP
jgi:hypothetical protein